MATVKEKMRFKLLAMAVNETIRVPLNNRSSMVVEMADIRVYDDREFKGHIDKTRNEYEVRRIR